MNQTFILLGLEEGGRSEGGDRFWRTLYILFHKKVTQQKEMSLIRKQFNKLMAGEKSHATFPKILSSVID